ncbi:MAG: N-acetylmuramoyl-L-alanine amidase [Lentimicrobiaceae bacterium]|nr:N-acetylmuramoyl-L-alanine amidase [Lentimicrobiaceae bacterium]
MKSAKIQPIAHGIFLFFLLFFFGCFPKMLFSAKGKEFKVVIDAGHGGKDPGAVRGKIAEKDITLAIALKAGKLIEENYKDVEVIYTRKTDEFIELHRRAQIANEKKADLFISIHCNANPSSSAYGTETFVMGLHKSQANLTVAKTENSSILFENDYSNQYDGFDPNSAEANIIFTLFQNVYIDQSLDFAASLQEKFREKTKMNDRGVKQAGFLVLYKTAMPGVLIETGFLSNPKDVEYLTNAAGQSAIAQSIYNAFCDYRKKLDKEKEDILYASKEKPLTETKEPKNNKKQEENSKEKNQVVKNTEPNKPTPVENTKSSPSVVSEDEKQTSAKNEGKTPDKTVYFRIQFTTSPGEKPLTSPEFGKLQDVKMYFHNGLYKFTTGNETAFSEAVHLLKKIKATGFKDAFIVAFINEERVTITEKMKNLGK